MLSITTDYAKDKGDPSPYLRRIADAGFTHVHWCHHWNTDFLYSRGEIRQILKWLAEYHLRVLDLHASVGPEKNWYSPNEYQRRAGVELVKNRVEMTARLGSDVIIMHIPADPGCIPLRKSLGELERTCRRLGVRIAIENGHFESIRRLLGEFDADYLGLCYDCGHGNLIPDGLDQVDRLKDRLISVHLHDNNGVADQHKLPFTGTVDWKRLTRIMTRSAYSKCVSMESNMHQMEIAEEEEFLKRAFVAGKLLTQMIAKEKELDRAGVSTPGELIL